MNVVPRSWSSRRWLLLIPAVLATLALVAPSSAAANGIRVHMHAAGHHPVAGKKWPIKVIVKKRHGRHKARVSGKVKYNFLLGSEKVASRPGHRFKHGTYHDKLVWPKAAVGHKLKLRVVVKTKHGRGAATWWVRVRK